MKKDSDFITDLWLLIRHYEYSPPPINVFQEGMIKGQEDFSKDLREVLSKHGYGEFENG